MAAEGSTVAPRATRAANPETPHELTGGRSVQHGRASRRLTQNRDVSTASAERELGALCKALICLEKMAHPDADRSNDIIRVLEDWAIVLKGQPQALEALAA